jgi:hypothetical protein
MEVFFISVGHFERFQDCFNTFPKKLRLLFRNVRLLFRNVRLLKDIFRKIEASV